MINFLQVPPVEPQPGFMQQYSFIIMIGLMVLVFGSSCGDPNPSAASRCRHSAKA